MTPRVVVRVAGWLLALTCTGVALWRFFLGVLPDDDGFGEAHRVHSGLLVLQALCALVAAGAVLGLGEAFASGDRRGRAACLVLLVAAAAGFALVFTKADLLAWGVYEN